MAELALNKLQNPQLLLEKVSNIKTKSNQENILCDEMNQKSSEEEFIPFFLDNLRNQLTKVLQDFTNCQVPTNKISTQSPLSSGDCKLESTEHERISEHDESTDSMLLGKKSFEIDNSKSFDLDNSLDLSNSFNNHSRESLDLKNPIQRKKVKLLPCTFDNTKINSAFKFENQSFPSLSKSSTNINDISKEINKNFSHDESYRNSTSKNKMLKTPELAIKSTSFDTNYSNSVSKNILLKTPESPIANSSFPSHNRSNIIYNDNSQQCFTSTPKNRMNNITHNYNKRSPIQLNLGDFIQIGTKKSSSKKRRSKGKAVSEDINNVTLSGSPLVDTQQNTSGEHCTKRKVNPTRISFSSAKESENKIFKDDSKPFTENPQFTEVPTIDKTDNFQDERSLLREQKEKRPEKNCDNGTSEGKLNFKCQTSNITTETTLTVIPDLTLVKNEKILNQLAEMYSKFLDLNLVVNTMSEIYFIINLLTTQYKHSKNLITEKNIDEENDKIEVTNESDYQKSDVSTSLGIECELLNDSLIKKLKQIDIGMKQTPANHVTNEKNPDKSYFSKESITIKNSIKMYLITPHDCVYFACQVLNNQKYFLKCLNRATLKLLSENKQISVFQPELCNYLKEIYQSKLDSIDEIKSINICPEKSNVCFQKDEDNYENFTSNSAFQIFKKQRDIFYEVLKKWEDHHTENHWNFKVLKNDIHRMLAVDIDATNYVHLTRLFKSQMLNSCVNSGQQEDVLDDKTADFIKNLKDVDSEKINLLSQKLITPLSQNGPVPLPSFPGIQEFYKDFIKYAMHPMFYLHLENTFNHEIMELNNSQFTSSDIEETKTEVDIQTKQKFNICLSSLGILGKFLGFLISLPYKLPTISQWNTPSVDLQYCLNNSVINGKLSLTVPWIVEYLAVLDSESLQLPYYKKILEVLYCIYRASSFGFTIINPKQSMSPETVILLKLVIGWLFSLPKFPIEFYYSWQSKYKSLKTVDETLHCIIKYESRLTEADIIVNSTKGCLFIDRLDLIDDKILYNCCPFLKELLILLMPRGSRLNNPSKSRHVTPVTYQLQKSTKKTSIKHLEIELEKAFFNGQPESTKKTVEYISERIASSCRKHIYKIVLPSEGKILFEELKKIIHEKDLDIKNNYDLLKNLLANEMDLLSKKASDNFKEVIEKTIFNYCESCIRNSIESLLAQDCSHSVKEMCIRITVRMTMERVNQWINSRIVGIDSKSNIFLKQMESELYRYCKIKYDETTHKIHNPNAPSPVDVLEGIRELICNIIKTGGQGLTEEVLLNFWDQLYQSLTERLDSKPMTEKTILSYSIDFCLFLITYRQDLMTEDLQEKIFKTWKLDNFKQQDTDTPFVRMLCPRNLVLLEQSKDYDIWSRYGRFLKELLKQNILTISILRDQVVFIILLNKSDFQITNDKQKIIQMKSSLTENNIKILRYYSICLKKTIENYNINSNAEIENLQLVQNFISTFC